MQHIGATRRMAELAAMVRKHQEEVEKKEAEQAKSNQINEQDV